MLSEANEAMKWGGLGHFPKMGKEEGRNNLKGSQLRLEKEQFQNFFPRMEKGEEVGMTERGFFCLGEGSFALPLSNETTKTEMVSRKKNI